MPAHIRKGLITGAPAFNSGGLGLSIGSRTGGSRHKIAARAPDGGKTGGEPLSFFVNDLDDYAYAYADAIPPKIRFAFFNYQYKNSHPTYNILQNKNNVFLRLKVDGFDVCGNSIDNIPLSKFITNVTSSSFEIEIPPINATDLSNIQVTDYSGGSLTLVLSGSSLVKGTNNPSLFNGNTFFVDFNISRDTPIQQARTMISNYVGRTYKFELYTNDTGAIIVNGNTYKINRFIDI